ncbi:hypothetical protein JQV19_08330 [Sulfitobacter mediterraneus]|uniref:hypothetical protein n=1 Tax=Sulfitobacter mediterraneus TaxID=83219 RepID=UPI00193A02FA|nr:hypothetical protein [Sulfitobacter mediterraneus]MBM1556653.1 hypothetical protein [Sulfitobacter mediterraneus]MBM1570151.1 hypothetical protein [Sulfitobacter mediterraneus]MBM1574107.1 hypothetical protein [Sulfitobacter mediterraneus]MBM1577893.1 hypothetical protein [Sulfitobacter mediterraneus]MBM1579611.1 hypothetical protein [Sulfitobacter mediterraneus]
MTDIEALNRKLRTILLDDGKTYPITNWFDNNGNDCDPDEAEFAVAGPDSDGKWYTIELGEYSHLGVH